MLNDKDLLKIGQVIDQTLDNRLGALEQRINEKIIASEQRIIAEIGNFIHEDIIPQIDDHENRITSLEKSTLTPHQIKSKK